MEKGMMDKSVWISGNPNIPVRGMIKIGMWPIKRKVEFVTAWRCSACGEVKLQVLEPNK